MTSSGTSWLVAQFRGRQLATPADQWRAAEAARDAAESRGDRQAVDEADQRLDELVSEWREQDAQAKRDAAKSARFSSGVRRPVVRPKSASEAMAEALLIASGRLEPRARGLR